MLELHNELETVFVAAFLLRALIAREIRMKKCLESFSEPNGVLFCSRLAMSNCDLTSFETRI